MISSLRSPVAGFAVNKMPDTSEGTDLCDHGHGVLGDPVLVPVTDGLRGPQRSPAVLDGRHHRVGGGDVEKRLLLTGEGGPGRSSAFADERTADAGPPASARLGFANFSADLG